MIPDTTLANGPRVWHRSHCTLFESCARFGVVLSRSAAIRAQAAAVAQAFSHGPPRFYPAPDEGPETLSGLVCADLGSARRSHPGRTRVVAHAVTHGPPPWLAEPVG